MNQAAIHSKIEHAFRRQVQKDKRVKNAYLLVHSDKLGVHLNIAEGTTGDVQANPGQPNHMASVGKLFTATVVSILYEWQMLDFDDPMVQYLDDELTNRLHVFKGKDYTGEITIRHLLMQTSGLNDVFYHLWKKMTLSPDFRITPREAVIWGKENLKPVAVPGKKHFYTDTNYYLLGLIVERITGKRFHEVVHELIFDPLGMQYAYMHGVSKPKTASRYPASKLFIENIDVTSVPEVHQIDYAGGSVIAPLEDFLIFIKALQGHKIVAEKTLRRMIEDDVYMGFPTVSFNYGYSIWKLRSFPLLIPKKYFCWGCVGVTGAFMFYHPATDSFIIGTFNDFSYRGKALEFMVRKVIVELLKLQKS
jgi:D-alanyl-D-alanine carboxypeptidase